MQNCDAAFGAPLRVIVVDEVPECTDVIGEPFRERKRLAHQSATVLAQGVVESLDMVGFAAVLAAGNSAIRPPNVGNFHQFGYQFESERSQAYHCMADGTLKNECITALLKEKWKP